MESVAPNVILIVMPSTVVVGVIVTIVSFLATLVLHRRMMHHTYEWCIEMSSSLFKGTPNYSIKFGNYDGNLVNFQKINHQI